MTENDGLKRSIILPKRLEYGDTIGIFSPSSPITAHTPIRFNRAKKYLTDKGFKIFEGNLTGKKDYYRSGTIQERADELNELIRNPEIQCIMSVIGGMNSNSILPYIDYEQLKKTPKIIIGYSDVTAILLGVYAETGLITFYGPALVASFGEFPPFVDDTFSYFNQVLIQQNKAPCELINPLCWTDEFIPWETQDRAKIPRNNVSVILKKGVASGRLIGGNLSTMHGIWGSRYMPEIETGDILLIEDCEKDIATIERSFMMLKLNGIFHKIGGLIIGKHERFNDLKTGRKNYDVLKEILGEFTFPVLADFDCSHTIPMMTLPIGAGLN